MVSVRGGLPTVRQQVVDAVDRVLADAREHVAQVLVGIQAGAAGGVDQREPGRG